MSQFMQEKWPIYEGSHGMRNQLFDILTDADLAFNPGGTNMTLGALWKQMGEIEYDYNQSLKTFTQDWDYKNNEAGLENSVVQLKTWFQELDDEMKATVSAMSDEDMKKSITRRGGYSVPVETQLEIYLQALLIFFGKATIFLRAMNKPLPQSFADWIW